MILKLYNLKGKEGEIQEDFVGRFLTKDALRLFIVTDLLKKNRQIEEVFYNPINEHRQLVTVYSINEHNQRHITDYLLLTIID